jgi:insulysin
MKSVFTNLTKSKSDKRNYLYKQLPNQLKCLLIQDQEADKSSAAMNVNIGSLLDPKEFYGLAHFLEHMLFMGTAKYPSENDFMEFLNQNSGHSNAFTDLDSTNYFFDVSNESYNQAIDRFAQFFIKPLFNPSAIEREVQQVDSENKKNLQSDMWRFLQLMRSEGNVDSIFTRFSTGNLETLNKPNIRDALLDFHKKYYSSNLMSLVMLSPKPLEEMEKITDDLFTHVEYNQNITTEALQKQYSSVFPYEKNNTGFFYKIIPVKDKDEISFYWFINENTNPLYDQKPLTYLSSLFGHEGPNSLTSSLVKDDLIHGLSSGYSCVANTFTKFYIHIDLTKKGLNQYDHVVKRVLHHINKIKEKEINRRFFDELRMIQNIRFDFKNKEDPTNYVSDLAYSFTVFKPEDILTGPYLIKKYDEEMIRKYLLSLNNENMNVYLSSKSFEESECGKTEVWYGTKYDKEKFIHINDKKFSYFFDHKNLEIRHTLDYPPSNKFIPDNFNLLKNSENLSEKYPTKILSTNNTSVWYKQDDTFQLPKAAILLQIFTNKNFLEAKKYDTICSIWNAIFDNELKDITYMAGEANIHFRFFYNLEGIYLQVSGFNSSLKTVLYEVLNKLKSVIENSNSIENLKEKLKVQIEDHKKGYKNFYLSAPYTQAVSYLESFLRDPSSTPDKKLEFLNEIEHELDDIISDKNIFNFFLSNFLKESKFEFLIQGNISQEESLEIAKSSEQILLNKILKDGHSATFRIANIPKNTNFYYTLPSGDPKNQNSAIVSYFQAGNMTEYDKCCMFLIESLLREKFFDEMRTKQTLGYIVRMAYKEVRKIEGFVCVVQSSVKSPEDVQERITKFLIENNLKNGVDDELFEMHRQSVLTDLKMKDLKLMEEVSRNFSEIKRRDFCFDRRFRQIELVEKIKKEDVVSLYEKIFISEVRRLDVSVLAENHKEENEKFENSVKSKSGVEDVKRIKVESTEQFKKSVGLYPDLFSIFQNLGPKF